MDYIREMLLRQHQILSIRMVGEVQQAEEDHPVEDMYIQQEKKTKMHLPAVELQNPERVGFKYGRYSVSEKSGKTERTVFHERAKEQRGMPSAYQAEDTGVSSVYVPYERISSAIPANAREVSRSIQRDARRYDGSFSIY